ncbi:YidB family protein [Geminicoccus flavidas]|uniref:YidB family protein n=1 Tax=Geminicoccus flavidas TaxID=2506407 RepID=UPI0013595448|nr:YidB family protein [Geminicoccus flavidas]
MSRGLPSMTALLGLLAVAGYQHRDQLAQMFGGTGQAGTGNADPAAAQGAGGGLLSSLSSLFGGGGSSDPSAAQGGGMLGGLGGLLGGATAGSVVSSGISELMEHFTQNGHGEAAASWVGTGDNHQIAPEHLEQAIGPDVLATLTQQTGLSQEELLARLSKELPHAIDKYTPDGQVPA